MVGGGGGGGGGGSSGGGDSYGGTYTDTCIPNCNGDAACINGCKKTSTAITASIVSVVGVIFLGVGAFFLHKKNMLPDLQCLCCFCH